MSREINFEMLSRKVKEYIRKYMFFSFNSTINWIYISIIIIFVSITGTVSYLLATKQIEDNAYRNINDTVLQTSNYLEFILFDVFEQLVLLSNDPKISALTLANADEINPQLSIEIDDDVKAIYHRFNSMIESIYIDIGDGKATFYQGSEQVDLTLSYEDYFTNNTGGKEGYYWKNTYQNNSNNDSNEMMSVFKLIGNEDTSSKGVILFNLRADFIEQIFNKSLIGENGYLTLISPDGKFQSKEVQEVYELDKESLSVLDELKEQSGKYTFKNSHGENMNAIYNTLGVNKWKVAAVFPESEMLKTINNIKYFTIIFLIIIIIMATFIVNIVGKYISNPIKELANQMIKADRQHLKLGEGLTVPKEMEILYQSFNEQMAHNNTLMKQIELEQKEKRQLEVAVIQAQVNPHFLYNTLYSIKGLCDMGLNEDASEMISELSNFFRISISRGNEIITIEEEIAHIQSYLFIMEMRYGDDFTYTIDVEEQALSGNIVKLALQPLIENAIYHGVKLKREQGSIAVNVFQLGEKIHLEVIDNGLGIKKDKLLAIREEINAAYNEYRKKHVGIGLRSVNERIKGYFGKEYGLSIESKPAKGTKITIIIPKVKEEINE